MHRAYVRAVHVDIHRRLTINRCSSSEVHLRRFTTFDGGGINTDARGLAVGVPGLDVSSSSMSSFWSYAWNQRQLSQITPNLTWIGVAVISVFVVHLLLWFSE